MYPVPFRYTIIRKVSELATAGFGLVAALAWNDAIQSLFRDIFGAQSATWAKFAYALIVTGLVVFITIRLGAVASRWQSPPHDQNQ